MAVVSSRVAQARKWMSVPEGWDTGWKAARSLVGSSPAYVTVIGDSNSQGMSTTSYFTKSFSALLRNALVAKHGLYGDYYGIQHSARFNTVLGNPSPAGTFPWTFDTTWGNAPGLQYNSLGTSIMHDTATGYPLAWVNAGSAMFVTPYACTDFDIIHHDWQYNASTWKYNIDNAAGGGLVTVTQDARNSMRRTAITGQTNAVHTIRIGGSSVQYATGLCGIATYDPTNAKTKGIGFGALGGIGYRVLDWAGSANGAPDDRIKQLQGRYKTAPATTLETGFGFPTQPHLAIIELGINDCATNVGLVQFRTGLRRMCDALRRGRDNCSIMFLICPNPSVQTTDQAAQFLRAESWSLYADQIYGIAAEYQCGVFNVHADWMSTPVAQGFTSAGDAHPTDAGHQHIADTLATVIV